MTSSLGKSLGKLTNCCYTTAGTAGTQQERTERRLSEFKTSAQGTAPGKKNVPIKEEIDETKGHGYLLDDTLQILQTTQCTPPPHLGHHLPQNLQSVVNSHYNPAQGESALSKAVA